MAITSTHFSQITAYVFYLKIGSVKSFFITKIAKKREKLSQLLHLGKWLCEKLIWLCCVQNSLSPKLHNCAYVNKCLFGQKLNAKIIVCFFLEWSGNYFMIFIISITQLLQNLIQVLLVIFYLLNFVVPHLPC